MKLRIGFSPCPNDTFIFDALIHGKIDTGDIRFDPVLEDVETLNQWAQQGKLDITKLSFPAFFSASEQYILLDSGSALGKGVGPLLVKNTGTVISNMAEQTILIPGTHTTANLLLHFAYPEARNKQPMLFSEIEDLVLSGMADMGVLIHENRFTYREKGLEKIADLGEVWEDRMQVPVPLGGIAVKRSLDPGLALQVQQWIGQSLEYAWARYPLLPDYVRQHAQTMSEDVMRQHIQLYVNDFSLTLGTQGKEAVLRLMDVFHTVTAAEKKEAPPGGYFLS